MKTFVLRRDAGELPCIKMELLQRTMEEGDDGAEDGASTWEEPKDCPRADPATGETSLPEVKGEPPTSSAQPITCEPSPEHSGSERTVERRTDPDRLTEKRMHPVSKLPGLEEETHTGADGASVQ